MADRVLTVTLTVVVRDMTGTEYDEAGGASAEELLLDEGEAAEDVVGTLDASEFTEIIEGAFDSETYPELLAGTGLMVVMGDAKVEGIQWTEAA